MYAINTRCAAFDMDTSDRMVCEGNEFHCTVAGPIPHGNSISAYDWNSGHPSSRFWSFARNLMTRPPFQTGAGMERNWIQRETMTTDGSGAFATGVLSAPARKRRGNTIARNASGSFS